MTELLQFEDIIGFGIILTTCLQNCQALDSVLKRSANRCCSIEKGSGYPTIGTRYIEAA